MSQTIYASFADISMAEKAAGALLDYGVRKEDISIVAGTANSQRDLNRFGNSAAVLESNVSGEYETTLPTGSFPADTLSGTIADTTSTVGEPIAPSSDRWPASATSVETTDPMMQNSQISGSAPVLDPVDREAIYRGEDEGLIGEYDPIIVNTEVQSTAIPIASSGMYQNVGSSTAQAPTAQDYEKAEGAAKGGISTTTAADAGQGAMEGAGWGLGVGILAGLAALMVPGVGLVFGAGALATAIGGAALTTAGGAIAGGVTGYLKDMGVPEQAAVRYEGYVSSGQALVAVHLPSGDVDVATGQSVLDKYGASDIGTY